LARHENPTDPYCNRVASDIPDLVAQASYENETPNDAAMQDGTYNPETNEFCCDTCYVSLGAPTAPGGWKAGDPIET
jgi:hypothetical protein